MKGLQNERRRIVEKESFTELKIAYYRKRSGLTQKKLAELIGVSSQAVSKWEQKISCPDIMLLPRLAEVFGISIDELFGKKAEKEIVYSLVASVPWNDDGKLRFAVFEGKKLVDQWDNDRNSPKNFNFKAEDYKQGRVRSSSSKIKK